MKKTILTIVLMAASGSLMAASMTTGSGSSWMIGSSDFSGNSREVTTVNSKAVVAEGWFNKSTTTTESREVKTDNYTGATTFGSNSTSNFSAFGSSEVGMTTGGNWETGNQDGKRVVNGESTVVTKSVNVRWGKGAGAGSTETVVSNWHKSDEYGQGFGSSGTWTTTYAE